VSNLGESTTAVLLQRFSPFATMLFFAPANDLTQGNILFNATAGLVDTGKRKLVVTNSQVYKRFKELRSDIRQGSNDLFCLRGFPYG